MIYETTLNYFGTEISVMVTLVDANAGETDEDGNEWGYDWRILKVVATSDIGCMLVDITKIIYGLGDEPLLQEAIAHKDTWEIG